jgi:hypothetical protein
MKLLFLACIMAAAMNAQPQTLVGLPDLKVELSGTPETPMLINHSERTIIGYILHVEDDSQMQTNIPVYRLEGILPGATDTYVRVDDLEAAKAAGRQAMAREVHRDGSPVIVARTSIDSVIFSDGQFAGPDVAQFYRFAVAHINATREFASQALGDMTKVEAAVHASRTASPRDRFYRRGNLGEQLIATRAEDALAEDLLEVQNNSGVDAARQKAFRLSKIPALWKGETK